MLVGDWSPRSGYEAGQPAASGDGESAIFVANDQMALGVLRALHEANHEIPRQVSVVGFDDIPEAQYFTPPLTTVRQDFAEIGRRSLALLLEMMESGGEGPASPPLVALVVAAVEYGAPLERGERQRRRVGRVSTGISHRAAGWPSWPAVRAGGGPSRNAARPAPTAARFARPHPPPPPLAERAPRTRACRPRFITWWCGPPSRSQASRQSRTPTSGWKRPQGISSPGRSGPSRFSPSQTTSRKSSPPSATRVGQRRRPRLVLEQERRAGRRARRSRSRA